MNKSVEIVLTALALAGMYCAIPQASARPAILLFKQNGQY